MRVGRVCVCNYGRIFLMTHLAAGSHACVYVTSDKTSWPDSAGAGVKQGVWWRSFDCTNHKPDLREKIFKMRGLDPLAAQPII